MASNPQTRRIVSYLFIGALALLFAIEWGPGSRGCTSGAIANPDTVATVNGKPVAARDFAIQYAQQLEELRRGGISGETLKRLNLPTAVVSRMVDTELVAQAANARGIKASDDDLRRMYEQAAQFQEGGHFNREFFLDYVRSLGLSEVQFEDEVRRQLAAQRLLDLVASTAVVSPEDVKGEYLVKENTAKIAFVRFNPTMYANVIAVPTAAEVAAWQAAHQKEVADYYQENQFTYSVPEKVTARQIFKRVAPNANAADKDKARTAIADLRTRIQSGSITFEKAAEAESDDSDTKAKGGQLGAVDRLALPTKFADALFEAKVGDITNPVETPAGFFIGQIEAKEPARQTPLESVATDIARQLVSRDRTLARARTEALAALAKAKAGSALSALFPSAADDSTSFGYQNESTAAVRVSPVFDSGSQSIPGLGDSAEVLRAIFAQTVPGLIPQLLQIGNGFVLVQILDRKLPSDSDFATKRGTYDVAALGRKREDLKQAFVRALRDGAAIVLNPKVIERIVGSDA